MFWISFRNTLSALPHMFFRSGPFLRLQAYLRRPHWRQSKDEHGYDKRRSQGFQSSCCTHAYASAHRVKRNSLRYSWNTMRGCAAAYGSEYESITIGIRPYPSAPTRWPTCAFLIISFVIASVNTTYEINFSNASFLESCIGALIGELTDFEVMSHSSAGKRRQLRCVVFYRMVLMLNTVFSAYRSHLSL